MNLTNAQKWFLIGFGCLIFFITFICMLVTMFSGVSEPKTEEQTKMEIYQKCLTDAYKFDSDKETLQRFQDSCYDAAYKPLQ